MMENTKCECGHQNYVGTVLCESCGKPLYDDQGTGLLEMRYDGVARRSQRSNPTWIDRIWNFLSSVRNAVIMILMILVASVLGTIYPQENTFMNIDPAKFYEDGYGTLGKIYYFLGLSHTYSSWWYKLLLVLICASLIVCSLDRVLPLYRALSKQKVRKHLNFLRRQKVVYAGEIDLGGPNGLRRDAEEWVRELVPHLKKRHYRVYTDGTALLAEKYRFSRWGPYINHIGLIIFLLAVLMRGIPGWYMEQYIGFLEGEIQKIPDTSYYLKNEKFTVELYKQEELPEEIRGREKAVPKRFETKAVLYECTANCDDPSVEPELKEVARHDIIVNKPLNYHGFLAYQYDFKETPQIRSIKVGLKNKATKETYGTFQLDMKNPKEAYDAGPYHLAVKGYFPEFDLNEQGKPITKSNVPNVPAFVFLVTGPDLPKDGEVFVYFVREIDKQRFSQDHLNGNIGKTLDISASSMKDVEIANYTSYLNIRVDRALPYIFFGAAVFMIGLVMGLYWQHRRIWLRFDDENVLTLGAHTNKNWYGLKHEVSSVLAKMELSVEPKGLENEVKK